MLSSVLWILLATGLYGLAHSLLAALRVKEGVRRRFGPTADRYYRLAYNLFAVISLAPVLALIRLLPDRALYRVPWPWAAVFVLSQLGGLLLILVAVGQTDPWAFLGLRQLQGATGSGQTGLVVKGPYRWVRHPLYTGTLLAIWLFPVMTANLLAFNLGLTAYILIGARFEERKLVAAFGESYDRYRKQTPMLIPRPSLRN